MVLSAEDSKFITDQISLSQQHVLKTFEDKFSLLQKELAHVKTENTSLHAKLDKTELDLDDLQQYGRHLNIRVEGIGYADNETTGDIFTKLQASLKKADIEIQEADVIRIHRTSKPKFYEGKMVAQTIVKLAHCRIRGRFHGINKIAKNKHAGFRAHADLTPRWFALLKYAREHINRKMIELHGSSETIGHLPDNEKVFPFTTINSALRLRARGNVLKFNTEIDFNKLYEEVFGEEL